MKRVLKITVEYEHEVSIAFYLKHVLHFCRGAITALRKEGNHVFYHGEDVKLSTIVLPKEMFTLEYHEKNNEKEIVAKKGQFEIVYEDEDILLVNKPSDMTIHPIRTNLEDTLANAIACYYKEQGDDGIVFRAMNRLDRYTSGLVLIAKNIVSAGYLEEDVLKRRMEKRYLGIVKGKMEKDEELIDAPIYRPDPVDIHRVVDFEKGQKALTYYRVLGYREDKDISLVEFQLMSGRTHQIRVHMSWLGHPLIGDSFYDPKTEGMARQALHAYKLEFTHPLNKEKMVFEIGLPEDMKEVWENGTS